jgi:general secretion pathway protein B
MSLILDALRKSEAERQRGQAPGLFTPMTPLPMRRRRLALAPWLIGLALLVALALAWALLRETSLPRSDGPADSVATAAPAPNETAVGAPIAASGPPAAAALPTAAAGLPTAAAALPTAAAPATIPIATNATPPAPIPSAPAALPPPLPAPPVASAADNAVAVEDYLPRLSELDAAQRGSLPPLKLSMHVWSEQPERRIAIIDGQRIGEGANLGGAVVAEIRRDGVVLDLAGRRYLLPRP